MGSHKWGYRVPLRVPLSDLGFRVVISEVINPIIWVITIVTLLITNHEPPSRGEGLGFF